MSELVATYTLTLQDYQQLMAAACSTKRSPAPKWLRPTLIALWFAGVALFAVAFRGRTPWLLFPAILLPIVGNLVLQAATRIRLLPIPEGAVLGQRTLTVHEQGFTLAAREWETNVRWEAVLDVVDTPTHVMLMLDRASGLAVPKSALPTPDALRAYLPARLATEAAP